MDCPAMLKLALSGLKCYGLAKMITDLLFIKVESFNNIAERICGKLCPFRVDRCNQLDLHYTL